MKNKHLALIVVLFVLLVSTAGCGVLQAQSTYTPRPTYTPNPTYTTNPTYTPTNTPFPTLAIPANPLLPEPPSGIPIIDVTYQIKNLPVAGASNTTGGKNNYYWALDTMVGRLQIWAEGNSYVNHNYFTGTFITFAGKSPAGTGTVGAGITGTSSEEYAYSLTGSLVASPSSPLTGYIGSFDAGGDQQGNTLNPWPGINWYVQPGWKVQNYLGFSETYTTCGNGAFHRATNGITGDITGTVGKCSLMTQTSTWAPTLITQTSTKTSAKGGGRGPFASMTETPTETLTETPTETLTETPTETPTPTPTVPLQNPNCGSYLFNINREGVLYARNQGWGDLKVFINGVLVYGPLGYYGYWGSGDIKTFRIPDSNFSWEVDYADQYMLNLKYNYCVITGSYSTPTPILVETLTESPTPMSETPTGTLIGTPIPTPTEPNFSLTDPNSWLKGIEWLWEEVTGFLKNDIWIPLQNLLKGRPGTSVQSETGLWGCTVTDLKASQGYVSAVMETEQNIENNLPFNGLLTFGTFRAAANGLPKVQAAYNALPDCVRAKLKTFNDTFTQELNYAAQFMAEDGNNSFLDSDPCTNCDGEPLLNPPVEPDFSIITALSAYGNTGWSTWYQSLKATQSARATLLYQELVAP